MDTKEPTQAQKRGCLGGHARAKAMTAEARSAVAKKAARARWKLDPVKATHSGKIKIGDIEIECAVLPDGRRVLSERTIMTAMDRSYSGYYSENKADGSAPAELPNFLAPKGLRPFIQAGLTDLLNRAVGYVPVAGVTVCRGLDAQALPMICEVWLKARDSNALKANQAKAAAQADIIMRGLAHVGIMALVDEASGYQAVRDQNALQALLDRYLRRELAAWAKRFPDEFYKQIFRLRGWEWRGMKVNRPGVVGHYTKDLVYARLAPGLLEELQQRQPKEGARKPALHQWLSDDIGCPALSQHIHAVIALMRASKSWNAFMALIDAALPRREDTLTLPVMADAPDADGGPVS